MTSQILVETHADFVNLINSIFTSAHTHVDISMPGFVYNGRIANLEARSIAFHAGGLIAPFTVFVTTWSDSVSPASDTRDVLEIPHAADSSSLNVHGVEIDGESTVIHTMDTHGGGSVRTAESGIREWATARENLINGFPAIVRIYMISNNQYTITTENLDGLVAETHELDAVEV